MFTVVAWSMFSQRKTECHPTVIPFHGISTYDLVCWGKQTEVSYGNTIPRNLVVWYVEETFRIDELLCCFDVKVLVCKAMKMFKSWWPKNDERTTKDERRTNELIGPNFCDLIGTNSDRLVRIPNDWSKFRTNDEWRVRCCDWRERVWRSEICQSVKCPKKIGVDWPRQSQFQKICQTVNASKLKNRRGLV